MRRIVACCGIVALLVWAAPNWKAANTSAAVVSISGSGMEMAMHVPAWVYWPAGAKIELANVDQNAATGGLSGTVEVALAGELTTTENDFIGALTAAGYSVRKATLPADRLFGAYSVLEAINAGEHRRVNIVLRQEPWVESARIFFIEEPTPAPLGSAS
jgi:hypothetical protein